MTLVFLVMTFLTSVTGFLFFKRDQLLPSHVTGIIALVVLAPTLFALYARKLAGGWRRIYVIGAVISLYLNVFVLVVQLFLKVPALHALAPTHPRTRRRRSRLRRALSWCFSSSRDLSP